MRSLIRLLLGFLVLLGVMLTPSPLSAAETQAPVIFVDKPKQNTHGPVRDNMALGGLLGEPSGISMKFWTRPDRAVDGGVAYSFRGALVLFGDYLFHFGHGFRRGDGFLRQLHPYAGLGGIIRYSLNDDTATEPISGIYRNPSMGVAIAMRIPVGIEWLPKSEFGLFVELVPILGFGPRGYGLLNGGGGLRYYF